MLHGFSVFGDALALAVDALKRVFEIGRLDGRLGNDGLDLVLFGLEIEGPSLSLVLLLLLLPVVERRFARLGRRRGLGPE